jgi:hypothetical protein
MRLVRFVGKDLYGSKYTSCEFVSAQPEAELEHQFLEWVDHFQLDLSSSFWAIGIETALLR